MRGVFALLMTATALASCSSPGDSRSAPPEETERPHIVLIMADDMGYTDIGCYGSEIRTPHLDALAEGGVRMTQFYNTSRCCPTRAALLTGLYSHQAGIGLMEGDRGTDAYRGILNRSCVTLAEALGAAGYAPTWRASGTSRTSGGRMVPGSRGRSAAASTASTDDPRRQGFWDPATLCRGDDYITPENDPEQSADGWYYTDAISDEAARFAREHLASSDDPLFLYVAYTSAHWPMHAPESWIARYGGLRRGLRAAARRGWSGPAAGRPRPFVAHERGHGRLGPQPNQSWDARNMETYAAMVSCMDAGIGRVLAALEDAGELDNTLVIYLQDNGACAEGMRRLQRGRARAGPRGPMAVDQLQPKIWPPCGPGTGSGSRPDRRRWPGPRTATWPTAAAGPTPRTRPSAASSTTPTRAGWAPCSSSLAGSLRFRARGLDRRSAGSPDRLMPTLLDAADATYPASHGGRAIQPMEGVSLLDAWEGRDLERPAPLAFEHHGNLALRDGRWKIVSQYRAEQPRLGLYDMEQDRTELEDLAARYPERLEAMVAAWQAWADRVGVRPWPL